MLRVLGWILAILGVAALIADYLATPEGGGFQLRQVGDYWFRIDRDSLQLAQPAIERHVAPWLWDPVILTILQLPAALVLLGLGLAMLIPALRKARK